MGMNSATRKEILFSDRASVGLFECLIVAGAPATGLGLPCGIELQMGTGNAMQKSIERLRDMWRRVDSLYVCQEDLEALHAMECKTNGHSGSPVPHRICTSPRKLARYYVYLLFRYCVSFETRERRGGGFARAKAICTGVFTQKGPMVIDIPAGWLVTGEIWTNQPSAPPPVQDLTQQSCQARPPPYACEQRQLGPHRGRLESESSHALGRQSLATETRGGDLLYPVLSPHGQRPGALWEKREFPSYEHKTVSQKHSGGSQAGDSKRSHFNLHACYESNAESGED